MKAESNGQVAIPIGQRLIVRNSSVSGKVCLRVYTVCVDVRASTRISVAIHEHSMQCRRLYSRAEGGEPWREHYAVHLAFSLINGGGAAANAGVVAAATAVFALVSYVLSFFSSLSFSFFLCLSVCLSLVPFLQSFFFHPFHVLFSLDAFFRSFPPFVKKPSDFQGGKKMYRNRARSNSTLWNGRGKNKPKSSSNQQSLFLVRFSWYRGRYGDAIIFT